MSVNLSPVAGAAAQFLDNSGNVLTGGKLYTYAAGTTTPQATYTSNTGVTFHPNPIILDASGRVPSGEIWLTDGLSYKFVLTDSNNVLIGTYDNIILGVPASQVLFTGFKGQIGTVQDLADNDGSDWVGFIADSVGAVAISAQDKMRETISIADFGAIGDGTTDDTAAIQAALDTGLDIFVPNGNYLVTDTLLLNNGYQSFFGQGYESKITFTFGVSSVGIEMGDRGNLGRQQIRNIFLNATANCSKVISVTSPFAYINNVKILNASAVGHGIYVEDEDVVGNIYGFSSRVLQCWITLVRAAGNYGVRLGPNSQNAEINGCIIEQVGTHVAIEGTNTGSSISNNVFQNSVDEAIRLGLFSGTPYIWNTAIQNNYFEQNQWCIRTIDGYFYNLVITNNYTNRNTASKVSSYFYFAGLNAFSASRNIYIENNLINDYETAFQLNGQYASNLISTKGNTLFNTTNWSAGTWANNAYTTNDSNAYFTRYIVSGTLLNDDLFRISSKDAVVNVPIQLNNHAVAKQLSFRYIPVGGTTATVELFKQLASDGTTTSLGSVVASTDAVQNISIDGYIAEANYSYYVTITWSNTGTTGYVYPFQLYLYR